ncbi:MAG: 6-phosphofructokinase [Verrucomicrobiae bacterium]|nr:6-phosphofructokinase [Verrucomicrobiae bacterium]
MASILRGNCAVAQSGSPSAAANASLAGVIQEALQYEEIEEVYGVLNGVVGILSEDLIDLTEERNKTIEGLKFTPGAALGSCRSRLKPEDTEDLARVLEVFKAHNVRYFFYIGGNDSMETADKINKAAQEAQYELRVIGVPKSIDNDLSHTDHCPGYGSAVKFLSTLVMEGGSDTEALATAETASVIEVMGRHTGWLAAGTALAKRSADEAPHIVLAPEIPFHEEKFIGELAQCLTRNNRAVIVVGEGLRDGQGKYLSQVGGSFSRDAFERAQLGGVCHVIRRIVEDKIGVKCKTARIGFPQRVAGHLLSATDVSDAVLAGQGAVKSAIEGKSGYMVTLKRLSSAPYKCSTGLAPLLEVATVERPMPREYFNESGFYPSQAFLDWARPLIQGEVAVPFENGLPKFVRLERHAVDKTCLLREVPAGV